MAMKDPKKWLIFGSVQRLTVILAWVILSLSSGLISTEERIQAGRGNVTLKKEPPSVSPSVSNLSLAFPSQGFNLQDKEELTLGRKVMAVDRFSGDTAKIKGRGRLTV